MRSCWRTAISLIAAVLVVSSAAAVILRIHASRHPVDTATVYAGDLAARGHALARCRLVVA